MAEYLQAEKKQEIFAKYGKSNTDTGSPIERYRTIVKELGLRR